MQNKKIITILSIMITVLAASATLTGIFSSGGNGEYEYQSN